MIYQVWRLSEVGPDNLGLACSEDGLLIGRTPLIERRDGRFVVRERATIEKLLKHVPQNVDGLMPRLSAVASALNANDPCLAHIAAVHLKIPDLPDLATRGDIEFEDALIRSVDWNPDLHPRAGIPPNPGWFAPTGGGLDNETSSIQTAQNDDAALQSDATPSTGNDRVRLPRGDRIDELGDFLEWLANATPDDEKAIRGEIKRYYYDVGDTIGGNALNAALSDALEPGITLQDRQDILNSIAPYATSDPAEVAQARNLAAGAILLFSGQPPTAVTIEAASDAWKLGWAARGQYFDALLRDGSLPPGFRTIDNFTNGIATSIKSIDLNAATYQDFARLSNRINQYIDELGEYEGGVLSGTSVDSSDIVGRALNLVVPKGSMTAAQVRAIEAARTRAINTNNFPVNLIITAL